jgi:hypothetical protein
MLVPVGDVCLVGAEGVEPLTTFPRHPFVAV